MKLRLYNLFFLVIFLSYTLSSCSIAKKNKDKRLIGAWNVINVRETSPTVGEQWIFDSDGKIYRMEISDTVSTVLDIGDWAITQKVNTAYINTVYDSEASTAAGLSVLWEILSLKKTTMILVNQDGGLMTREFERVN